MSDESLPPDAVFGRWERVRALLRRALKLRELQATMDSGVPYTEIRAKTAQREAEQIEADIRDEL